MNLLYPTQILPKLHQKIHLISEFLIAVQFEGNKKDKSTWLP